MLELQEEHELTRVRRPLVSRISVCVGSEDVDKIIM